MTKSKLYYLEDKSYEPIVNEIETNPRKHTLKTSIAVYLFQPMHYLIVSSNTDLDQVVVKHGALELRGDLLRQALYNNPDQYQLLYGNPGVIKFIDPNL